MHESKSESEVAQSCLTLHDPMDCSPPGSSIHGIFQATLLEWGAIAFSGSSLHPDSSPHREFPLYSKIPSTFNQLPLNSQEPLHPGTHSEEEGRQREEGSVPSQVMSIWLGQGQDRQTHVFMEGQALKVQRKCPLPVESPRQPPVATLTASLVALVPAPRSAV